MLVDTGEIDGAELLIHVQELRLHPWILLGWGVERKDKWKNFERLKSMWKVLIEKIGIPVIGIKPAKQDDDYYHPCPPLIKDRQGRLEELVEMVKKI